MELLKLPAGRLATVFYNIEPSTPMSSDIEKGNPDETLPPIAVKESRGSATWSQDQSDRKGHNFAWKNISLDLKVNGEQRRLLENIDGELPGNIEYLRTTVDPWSRLGDQGSNDSTDGCVWSRKGRAILIQSNSFANDT